MKVNKLLIAIALFFGWAISCFGQTAPLPAEPPISHLILTGTATGFKGVDGTQPASIAYAGLQFTKTFSAGYEQLTVSGLPVKGQFGIVSYANTLDTFLGKKITSHLVFDSSNMVLSLGGGAGKWLAPGGNHIAETFHVSLTYPLTTHMGWQLFGYQGFHAPGTSGNVNYTQTLSTGPVIYF